MKVLYDSQMFDKQQYGGITRYFANLILGISKLHHVNADVSVLFSKNYYLQAAGKMILNRKLGQMIFSRGKSISKWNKNYSRYRIIKNDFDVFHPTYFHPYFLKFLKKPFVITIHDMIYELYPEYFQTNDHTAENKRKLIENANHIIAISETTKNDLMQIANVPSEKITVVYHGYKAIKNTNVPQMPLPDSYMLFVGGRDNYKNFGIFAKAASEIMRAHPEFKVVCAGGGVFTPEEKKQFELINIHQDCIYQIDASDDLLYWLYRGAKVFIYPSLYEGFGLPILEAFEAECPVVLSETSSFREVAGPAALYFDPSSYNDLVECLNRLIIDAQIRKDLISLGTMRLPLFSMEKCLFETLAVYKKCLQN